MQSDAPSELYPMCNVAASPCMMFALQVVPASAMHMLSAASAAHVCGCGRVCICICDVLVACGSTVAPPATCWSFARYVPDHVAKQILVCAAQMSSIRAAFSTVPKQIGRATMPTSQHSIQMREIASRHARGRTDRPRPHGGQK